MPFRKRATGKPLTIFYAADVHGSEKCFRKFLNAASFYEADALILGGDLTGKALVPLVEMDDGSVEARFHGRNEVARDDAKAAALEEQIRFSGFYPFRIRPDELEALEADPNRRRVHFESVMSAEVERWLALADERLAKSGVTCIVIPGNDDEHFVGRLLTASQRVTNGEDGIVELGPFQVISYGYSNPTPWKTPRELPEEELEGRIEDRIRELDPSRPAIYNLHVPPFQTGIDEAPEIRPDLTLVGGASARMVPVGSHAVRRVIERHQPVLGLHGHIHESRGSARIGRTLCLNPGSEYNTGILKGVIVKLRDGEVASTQFVAA